MTLDTDNNVHVANRTDQNIYVLPLPDRSWALDNVFVDSAIAVALAEASASSEMPVASATFGNLINTLGDMHPTERLTAAVKLDSIGIEPGDTANMFERFRRNPAYTSSIARVLDHGSVDLLIMSEDGKIAQFSTDPEHSWIATDTGVVRALPGALDIADGDSGSFEWNAQQTADRRGSDNT
ncbi:hypothetical protein [Kitasatospora sp. NPDC089509]|uniref:hypothetical protein n=1 Tax=Kitasatospora sp. NPDC089509 TaxID=3364079 RepID=UPI003816287C